MKHLQKLVVAPTCDALHAICKHEHERRERYAGLTLEGRCRMFMDDKTRREAVRP